MSDRELSERLADDMGLHKWAAEARALEERVAELEGRLRADLTMMDEKDVAVATVTARAEAAEAEAARLRETFDGLADMGERLSDERDALRAKLEKVRATLESSATDSDPIIEAALAALDGEGDDEA